MRFRAFKSSPGTVRDATATTRTERSQSHAHDKRPTPLEGDPARRPWQLATWRLSDGQRYAVLREHARGGLGRILEASDRRLNRPVALKELIRAGDEEDEARFMREALITSRLEHPAIVPVHDLGRWPSGEPFIAMKMISGRSLRELIGQKGSLEERLALLPNVIAVADAMAYAHSQRIIHRDLNPSNVLIGEFGETFVIDWGLVTEVTANKFTSLKGVDDWKSNDGRVTLTGVVLGTAQYMPPEQAEGEPVDERADVYAIGAILYDVLAGVPPYDGKSAEDILETVLKRPPVPLERRQPGLAPELLTIVRKAMARNPAERYPSAKELAADLKRFQTGQLVSAHTYSLWGLASRRLRKYRLPVTLFAACLVAVVAMASLSVRRIIREKLAEAARNERVLIQARTSLDRDPTASIAWLKNYPIDAINWQSVRDISLEAVSAGVAKQVIKSGVAFASLSPDGRLLATAGYGKNVLLWDLKSGNLVKELSHSGQVLLTRFSPNGRQVLFFNGNGAVLHLWDIESGFVRNLIGHTGPINDAAFSPDGSWIATIGLDKTVRVWSTAGDENRILGFHQSVPRQLVFSSLGQRLATADDHGEIRLWSLDGSQSVELKGHPGAVDAMAFSRDGRQLAAAGIDGDVYLWEGAAPRRIFKGHIKGVNALEFAPHDAVLASGSDDGTVRLWDLRSGEPRVLHGHLHEVRSMAFAPNGQVLASGGQDGSVIVWDVGTGEAVHAFRGHQATVFDVSFSADGQTAVTSSFDKTTRVWPIPESFGRAFAGHGEFVYDVAWSPRNRQFATVSRDQTVRIWDWRTGDSKVLRGHEDQVFRVAFSADGALLASASFDKTVRLWDLASGTNKVLAGHQGAVWDIAFSPDGTQLASAGLDGTLRVWNLRSGMARVFRGNEGELRSVAFSPDGKLLASAGTDKNVRVWDVATGGSRILEGHGDLVNQVTFAPDGKRLASASDDQTVRVWDLATSQAEVLHGHTERIRSIAFAPDGLRLASASEDNTLRLWDLKSGTSQALVGHRGLVYEALFSPDGQLLASASADHTLRLWSVNTGAPVAVFRHADEVRRVAFSSDGRHLASVGADRTARLWSIPTTLEVPVRPQALHTWFESLTSMKVNSRTEDQWRGFR